MQGVVQVLVMKHQSFNTKQTNLIAVKHEDLSIDHFKLIHF